MTITQMILDALKRLAGSMKAWTMVLGLLTALGAKYGFNVDPATFWVIVGAFATLLGVQGATDWGKTAAAIRSTPVTLMPDTGSSGFRRPSARAILNGADGDIWLALTNGETHNVTKVLLESGYTKTIPTLVKSPPQSGFIALWLMAILTVAAVSAVVITLASCTASQKAGLKTVENSAFNCAKTEFFAEVVPVATILLEHPDDTGAQLDAIGLQAGSNVLACALKTVLDVLTAGSTHTSPSQAVIIAQSYITKHNFHYVGE